MLDHDTDSYYKISRAFLGGPRTGNLTREHILDNITLYWLPGTGISAARAYWESARARALGAGQIPRSWVQKDYPTLTYYNKPARGGHFAAWEEPELFTSELRAAFRPLR